MLRNAFFAALLTELIYGAWVMHETSTPMRRYVHYITQTYGLQIAVYAALLLLTLTLALMLLFRIIFLKGAGRKLQHATKELQQGDMPATPEHLFNLLQDKR